MAMLILSLRRAGLVLLAAIAISTTTVATASEFVTPEPADEAYNFVTHYRVLIEAPTVDVWPVLLDFRAWMYEFEHATVSGTPGEPGHVTRLYAGQDFMTQTTAVIPEKMISIVNLPLTFNGEFGTGVGIFTLHDTAGGTEVTLTMSRRYTPAGEGFADLRATRDSSDFQARTRAMWQDRFLERLKTIAEGRDVSD